MITNATTDSDALIKAPQSACAQLPSAKAKDSAAGMKGVPGMHPTAIKPIAIGTGLRLYPKSKTNEHMMPAVIPKSIEAAVSMVVVSARGKEYGRIAVPRSHLKAQKVAIERERALKVSDREVDVPDGCFGMDFHVGGYPRTLALRSRREREIFGPYMHLQAGQLVGSRALLTQRAVRAKVVGMAHKLPHWR